MGTNYYVYIPNEDVTKVGEQLHIGKSSVGWVFSLRVHFDKGINTLYDWLPVFLNNRNVITDEYGSNITADEMLQRIACRSMPQPPVNWTEREWELNDAEPGPNNLVRARTRDINQNGGCWHGEGTWNYCNYDFF